jgi:hypothetical protein
LKRFYLGTNATASFAPLQYTAQSRKREATVTARKQAPAKRGRKPAPPEEKTEPFTIRMTPRLRYGIELLARAQRGRSNSQVVEWALQRALNSVIVGNAGANLGVVLDQLWNEPSEWERLLILDDLAPELLDFLERSMIVTVNESREKTKLHQAVRERQALQEKDLKHANAYATLDDDLFSTFSADHNRIDDAFSILISHNWERLKEAVARREANSELNTDARLFELLGIECEVDIEAVVQLAQKLQTADA